MKTFGRTTIFANYTEEQLLSGTKKDIENKILDILKNSIEIHKKNKAESIYLLNYLYGDQDIKEKVKLTRTDINNKSVENWAWDIKESKQAFLLGKPIQYAPLNNISNEEISALNNYINYENKDQLDQELYEDVFATGRGYRYVSGSPMTEDDETPFNIRNLDVTNTEVVYSSSINHEQLLSFYETSKIRIVQEVNPLTGKKEPQQKEYNEYTVYTRNTRYKIDDKTGALRVVDTKPIIVNKHLIHEVYLNKKRMSWLEIGKDILNDINNVENLDLDDIQGFVNAIMVFTNAEVNETSMEGIKKFGAVSIKSTDQKKASVELLQSRLKSLDTQIFYLRKLQALHSILSVPLATNNSEISNAETGKASLTGQGFTSASVRVENEEKSFKKFDREVLKVILKICKLSKNSGIKNLKVSDIDIKFSRDLSDNLLVKTQALNNLMTANIPPEIANAVIGLFSDPVAVTKLQEEWMKQKAEVENQLKNAQNKNQEQNNKIQDTIELENQGQ